jgi:hypothetical protein
MGLPTFQLRMAGSPYHVSIADSIPRRDPTFRGVPCGFACHFDAVVSHSGQTAARVATASPSSESSDQLRCSHGLVQRTFVTWEAEGCQNPLQRRSQPPSLSDQPPDLWRPRPKPFYAPGAEHYRAGGGSRPGRRLTLRPGRVTQPWIDEIVRLATWPERCAAGPLHGPSGAARALAGLNAITWHSRVAASTMAARSGRFERTPWCFQARRLPRNEPGFVRVQPPRVIGPASRAPFTVPGALLRRLCTRRCSITSRPSWPGRPSPTPWATDCRIGSSATSAATWSAASWPMASPGPGVRVAATSG